MNRNGCLLRKAEINQLVSFDSRRLAEINNQLNQVKTMRIESPANSLLNLKSVQQRCPIWRERTTRVNPSPNARSNGVAVHGKPSAAHHGNRLLQILPRHGLHIRTRRESSPISLPGELQSDELLRAITSGKVNCLLGSCEPYEQSSESSESSNDRSNSVLERMTP
jgi:hypothetical protein